MNKNNEPTTYCFPAIDCPSESSMEADRSETAVDVARTQAYENGYAKGKSHVLNAQSEQSGLLERVLGDASGRINAHRRTVHHACQSDAVRLAVSIAREIIVHELAEEPKSAIPLFRNALEMVAGQQNIKIKIHPQDDPIVRSILSEEMPFADMEDYFTIVFDRSLKSGGCLIETDYGEIDARIDRQLDALEKILKSHCSCATSDKSSSLIAEDVFPALHKALDLAQPVQSCGHVTQVVGLVVEANGPVVQLGSICDIHGQENEDPVAAEVLGFRDRTVLMMPLNEIRTIGPGSRVVARPKKASVSVGKKLLGRVIDGLGNPIDGLGSLDTDNDYPIYAQPINPLLRQRINRPLDMGIRAINGLLTVGCGQRIGIFAGSGVGKSVLMGMIARKSRADVNVIALIGERGRELNEFIEKELGQEGLKKSVVIVATSDHLPLVRVRGAFVATAIAEYFRDQGLHVNFMMDSLTRFAMAQREIGLALGEPPTTKGYTPSVFNLMPKLLERAGTSDHAGTITGLYTVLVEGDDMNEPIADAARSILDGHIVLTRELADQNHYPAIDVLKSISRVMEDIAGLQHKHNAGRLKEMLSTYRKAEDLINIGAYVTGSNPGIDRAVAKIEQINGYLRQQIQENVLYEDSLAQLDQIMGNRE
jgi:flagellum-specific ATP synthase